MDPRRLARIGPAAALVVLVAVTASALPPDAEPAAAPRSVQLPYLLRTDSGPALHVNPDGSVTDGQNELFDAGGATARRGELPVRAGEPAGVV